MSACPDSARLVAASAGEDVVALAHAAGCPGCRRAMRDHLALRELAHELPAPRLDRSRRDGLAAELLARAEDVEVARPLPPAVIVEPRLRRAVAAFAITAGALAAAAAALAALDPPPPPASVPAEPVLVRGGDADGLTSSRKTQVTQEVPAPAPEPEPELEPVPEPPLPAPTARPEAATIAAGDGARYDRRSDGAIDRIALRDGTLTISATAAAAPVVVTGKNVRVRTGNARLAARAEAGVVRQVQVFAGSVEIHTGDGVVVVTAGETWTWDDPAAGTDQVAAFRTGWAALKAGEFETAARELERAEADRGVGEDATYWAAIAWGRAGVPDKARAGLKRFLDRYPNGTRAGEAHLALARLLDDPVQVRKHLEAAKTDTDPRVRAAAEAALEQLDR